MTIESNEQSKCALNGSHYRTLREVRWYQHGMQALEHRSSEITYEMLTG